MISPLTNTAAMSSLQALTATQRQLSRTQAQISSGLAVANASDNAAYWSIGQTMAAQVVGLGALNQGLALTQSIADVTVTALGSIKSSLDRIQADVVAARQSGVSLSAVQADISAQQQSIIAVSSTASFNGVSWLKQKTSDNRSTTSVLDIDVSKNDFNKIALGQEPLGTSNFESTITVVDTRTVNATSLTQTTTYGYLSRTTNAGNGAPTTVNTAKPVVVTGSSDFPKLGDVIVPMSLSSSGALVTSLFSLDAINLFSDYTGSIKSQQTTYFDHMQDPANSYGPISSTSQTTHSYDGYGGGSSPGILDPVVYVVSHSYSAPAGGSSTPSLPQQTVSIGVTGGTVSTVQQGASSSGAGSYTQSTPESILTLDITDASDADLIQIGQAVQTAIAGIVTASTAVGALQTQISTQMAYNASLSDALTSGIGSLVDADMNVASTRFQALQTEQQLGIQALSIANENGRLILRLFQAA